MGGTTLWTRIMSFFGATGSSGNPGPQGETGATGTSGFIAGMGPRGQTGFAGFTGPEGAHNDFSKNKGVWSGGYLYKINDYVIDPLDNNQYICIANIEDGHNPSNDVDNNWKIFTMQGHTGSSYDPGSGGHESTTGPAGPNGLEPTYNPLDFKGLSYVTGPTGDDGPAGKDGPEGPSGEAIGPTGVTGPTGFYIPSFPEWNSSTAYNKSYIVKYNSDLFISASDGKTTAGFIPPQTLNEWTLYFNNGTNITSGVTNPSETPELNTMFKKGDLYLNTETGELFEYNPQTTLGDYYENMS